MNAVDIWRAAIFTTNEIIFVTAHIARFALSEYNKCIAYREQNGLSPVAQMIHDTSCPMNTTKTTIKSFCVSAEFKLKRKKFPPKFSHLSLFLNLYFDCRYVHVVIARRAVAPTSAAKKTHNFNWTNLAQNSRFILAKTKFPMSTCFHLLCFGVCAWCWTLDVFIMKWNTCDCGRFFILRVMTFVNIFHIVFRTICELKMWKKNSKRLVLASVQVVSIHWGMCAILRTAHIYTS